MKWLFTELAEMIKEDVQGGHEVSRPERGIIIFLIICMIIIMDTEDSLDSVWSNKTTSNTSFFPAASASYIEKNLYPENPWDQWIYVVQLQL